MIHTHTHTHAHAHAHMEYSLAIKRNGILPLAITWMELKVIMLSEISQRKSSSVCYHLSVEKQMISHREQTSGY